jgi:flagellar hook-length control protein FliK
MIRAGEHKSRILMHPPELGRLDLNIAMKNGHLQANLGAESVMVKEIIEANLHQLKQQLNDQGLIVDRFEVMVGLDDGNFKENSMWSWNEQKGSYTDKKPLGKSGGPPENEKPAEKSIGSPYQIDVHV